ncbi:hypothetical protein HQ524_02765 [Candidatus Uhrbacteria bacterium]|nr:hypothetical protein [Candidatus Uhrbacteria bacterium]
MRYIITLFGIVGIALLISQTGYLYPHLFFSVYENDVRLYVGSEIITTQEEILEYEGTKVSLDSRTNFTIKDIETDQLAFYASRGHWIVTPDRKIKTCTRAVCATTSSVIEMRYYTPGEVVDIEPTGDTFVTFKDQTFELKAGDRMRIDELTGQTFIQSPSDGIDTSSTP